MSPLLKCERFGDGGKKKGIGAHTHSIDLRNKESKASRSQQEAVVRKLESVRGRDG